MQEEVENRTVNLAISTTKLTLRTIISGIRKYLQHREKVKAKKGRDPAVHGKQSVKKLLGQNQGAANTEIEKEAAIEPFKRCLNGIAALLTLVLIILIILKWQKRKQDRSD